MTHRLKFEIGDWLKILSLIGGMIIFGVTMRKDIDAQAATVTRIEQKVDALLITNAKLDAINYRIEDMRARLDRIEEMK